LARFFRNIEQHRQKNEQKGGKARMTQSEEIRAMAAKNSLVFILSLIEAIERGTTIVTLTGRDSVDDHVYKLLTVKDLIKNTAYAGLGRDIPKPQN